MMKFGRLVRNKRGDGERGQALVEFALIVPIFLLLVFAIVDFGMGFHAWITVTNAAREGARIGAVGADSATIETKVRDSTASLDDSRVSVVVTNAQGAPGEAVTVNVEYDYQLITPLSSIMGMISGDTLGPNILFDSTSEMRLE
jgi:Flp pilus assembly protein TadG